MATLMSKMSLPSGRVAAVIAAVFTWSLLHLIATNYQFYKASAHFEVPHVVNLDLKVNSVKNIIQGVAGNINYNQVEKTAPDGQVDIGKIATIESKDIPENKEVFDGPGDPKVWISLAVCFSKNAQVFGKSKQDHHP